MAPSEKFGTAARRWLAVLILIGAGLALAFPKHAASIVPAIPYLLGTIMFGMGLTLRASDFTDLFRRPLPILVGVVGQFLIMPFLGWAVGHAFGLDSEQIVGLILLGAVPGGTASTVLVFLGRGDVALTVTMTSVSTLIAPVVTPLLVLFYAGSEVPVNVSKIFLSIVEIVVGPVLLGLLVRFLAPRRIIDRVAPFLPVVSVVGIVLVIAGITGANSAKLLSSGLLSLAAVIIFQGIGFSLGYFAAWATRVPRSARRAICIEVGTRDAGLAASLATAAFNPLVALPAAVYSVWANIPGSALATIWSRKPADQAVRERPERVPETGTMRETL